MTSKNIPGAKRMSRRNVPFFYRKLGASLGAGIPLCTALAQECEHTRHGGFPAVLRQVRTTVDKGNPLSSALSAFPTVFAPLHTSMIRTAENTGRLPETLADIMALLENETRIRRKVRSALLYPCIVLVIAGGLIVFIVTVVVPSFAEMYNELGETLPLPTRILMAISQKTTDHGFIVLIVCVALVGARMLWRSLGIGRRAGDRVKLLWPIFGRLNIQLASARFARTYGQLIRSGVPTLNALPLAGAATENVIFEEAVLKTRARVEGGMQLSKALEHAGVFPSILIEMLETGEQSGRTDEMLLNVANYFDEEVNTMVDGMTDLLKPVLIVVLGLIVGAVVVAMMLPYFNLPSLVK